MSVEYCHKHNLYYDTDRVVMCPRCEDMGLGGVSVKDGIESSRPVHHPFTFPNLEKYITWTCLFKNDIKDVQPLRLPVFHKKGKTMDTETDYETIYEEEKGRSVWVDDGQNGSWYGCDFVEWLKERLYKAENES